jgi:phosphohistidine phosphatase
MRLYVMRHGPAEDHSATGRDEDRMLTPSGRDRVRDVVRVLVREGELPVSILTSKLVRASETAGIVALAMKAAGRDGAPVTAHDLAPGGNGLGLVKRLVAEGRDAPMVVGHEPDLSSLVETLLAAPMPVAMDKAMVVALELGDADVVTLRFILDPRSLELVHDARAP